MHTCWNMRLELLAIGRQRNRCSFDRLAEGQVDLGVAVLAVFRLHSLFVATPVRASGTSPGRSARSATEHRENIVDIRVAAAGLEADARTIAARTIRSSPSATAEHRSEDVGESPRIESARTGTAGEARATHTELADGVVLLTVAFVAEHVVRFGNVFELLLGLLGLVQIRMVLTCQLAVRLGDLIVRGVFGDTEDLVEILAQPFILSHDVPPFTRSLMSLRVVLRLLVSKS